MSTRVEHGTYSVFESFYKETLLLDKGPLLNRFHGQYTVKGENSQIPSPTPLYIRLSINQYCCVQSTVSSLNSGYRKESRSTFIKLGNTSTSFIFTIVKKSIQNPPEKRAISRRRESYPDLY